MPLLTLQNAAWRVGDKKWKLGAKEDGRREAGDLFNDNELDTL